MEISDLQIFYVTAKEGSISKAARKLNYVQSNVTSRIKHLERQLKTQLFYRHAKGVTLTPKGKILLQYTERIFDLIEETKEAVMETDTLMGSLQIGAIESVAVTRLPSSISRFCKEYPDVNLSLMINSSKRLIEYVLDFRLDGAFVSSAIDHPHLIQKPIFEEKLVMISSKNEPLSLSEARKKYLLVFEEGCSYRNRLITWMNEQGYHTNRIMVLDSLEAILSYVESGVGISIVSHHFLQHNGHLHRFTVHSLPENISISPVFFVYHKNSQAAIALERFIQTVKQSNLTLEEKK
ncbi:LysR family transcriptional regulator [Polycladomyces subterraneus]|uniref:LysR family transcriptional regulator n=1 Tax=Polycladomyces subterraneus TaxID=1016997 RepID=A0ABT8IJM4_9BACL|nr:LysR family transcriptional regulator [Polycladomyces subterraneus]MDN4592957.1 LysR family transcriptional regulator [Polycladomyces subterraneus]